jgi:hypothetical protein
MTEGFAMKRLLALCFLFLLTLQPLAAQTADPIRDENWREDVDYLWKQIQAIHPDPFRVTTQATFEQMVSDLDAQIPTLSDEQIVVRLFEIVAALRDGHSSISFIENSYPFHYYPLMFYPFSDGLYLVQAAPKYAEMVGAKLVKIGTTEIDQVIERLRPLQPRDNDWSGLVTLPMLLSMSDALLGTGLIEDADAPEYLLEQADGTQIMFNPAPIGQTEYRAAIPAPWRLPAHGDLLSFNHVDEPFWWEYLQDKSVQYVQYNQVVNRSGSLLISDVQHAIDDALVELAARRVILDLRYNGGGDINTARGLRNFIKGQAFLKTPGNLIVLTGRNTFSAATVFSLWLEQDVDPVFMGEPTGGRPLMFENARAITLPNSQIQGQIATRARRDVPASDTRVTITPQVVVSLASTDYFSDDDPDLAAALAYTPS